MKKKIENELNESESNTYKLQRFRRSSKENLFSYILIRYKKLTKLRHLESVW